MRPPLRRYLCSRLLSKPPLFRRAPLERDVPPGTSLFLGKLAVFYNKKSSGAR